MMLSLQRYHCHPATATPRPATPPQLPPTPPVRVARSTTGRLQCRPRAAKRAADRAILGGVLWVK
jgi:hypothetical protein